jgi:phage terminase large subunit
MSSLTLQVPEKLGFLYEPMDFKVAYGGRGAAKSWAFADALLVQGLARPLRLLCAREYQTSIKDSVHQLLRDRIAALGLGDSYTPMASSISGKNGTTFAFTGLRVNPSDLKSLEGVDICWVEEAQNVSKKSWDILTPTIRKDGSEIWASFNPELETDETYQRFVLNPPTNSIVREVSWRDNPWFNEKLNNERLDCLKRDPDGYLTIWDGKCRVALEGAVYAKDMRELLARGGVCRVPYDRTKPVHTAWDLGWGDQMAIVIFQQVGYEYRILAYIEDRHKTVADYVQMLKAMPFVYGHHYGPHDGANHNIISGTSWEETMKELFMTKDVHIVPATNDDTQHTAVRNVFTKCVFDEKGTVELRNRLARYKYGQHSDGSSTRAPIHDSSSHGAKAFACLAMGYAEGHDKPKVRVSTGSSTNASGWMAS